MILLCSETRSDYSRYLYPYAVWAVPEPGERPRDFFRLGFLPASPQLDRYVLCRNLRVRLKEYRPSSENRRILRKGEGIVAALIPRGAFEYTPERRARWKQFADERFGDEVMSYARLDRLMAGPVISHLLHFTEPASGAEMGTALLCLDEPEVAHYYYAFYDLAHFRRSLGLFMMTTAVGFFAQRGFEFLHLGTCYSQRALYKAQFAGCEFQNGFGWSRNLDELKFLVRREQQPMTGHVLEMPEFLETFCDGTIAGAAARGHFRLSPRSASSASSAVL